MLAYYIIFYHVTSYYIVLNQYHKLWYNITLYHITSCYIVWRVVISYYIVISYHIISCYIISYHVSSQTPSGLRFLTVLGERTNERTNKRKNEERTNERTNKRTNERNEWTNEVFFSRTVMEQLAQQLPREQKH